jgi:hypothetical protein
MESAELGWGWPCECVEFDSPLDIDALVGADEAGDGPFNTRRGQRGGASDPIRGRKQVCRERSAPRCRASGR